jgi:hypothetical protein
VRDPPHDPRGQPARNAPTQWPRQPQEHGCHRRAQPQERRRHHHEQQVLDHVRQQELVAERIDRRAECQEDRREPGHAGRAAAGAKALGHA